MNATDEDREVLADEVVAVGLPFPLGLRVVDKILASDVFARIVREQAADALDTFAEKIRHKQHPESVRQMAHSHATAIRSGVGVWEDND